MSAPRTRRVWPFVLGAGIAAQAVLLALVYVPVTRGLRGDEGSYFVRAQEIVSGKFPEPSLWPPLYDYVLAASFAIFGPRRLPIELLQTALFLASALLLHGLLRRAGVGERGALAATLLFVLDPQVAAFTHYFWPEILHLFLILAAAWLLFVPVDVQAARLLGSGALVGLALLSKSLLGPFLPVLVTAAAFRPPRVPAFAHIRRVALFCLGVVVVTLPAALWNRARFGTAGFPDSSAFNVWVGLNDPRSKTDYDSVAGPEWYRYLESGTDTASRNEALRRKIRDRVELEGLCKIVRGQLAKQYDRLLDHNSFFSDQLPGGRWNADAERRPWVTVLQVWNDATYAVLLVLACIGLCLLTRPLLMGPFAVPVLFLFFNLTLFLFLHVKTRFRIGFLPVLALLAGHAISRLLESRRGAPLPRLGLVAGGALAALAVLIAFRPA